MLHPNQLAQRWFTIPKDEKCESCCKNPDPCNLSNRNKLESLKSLRVVWKPYDENR